MENYKHHTKCRACDSTSLELFLDLGRIPLSNNLENTQKEAIESERFPLQIMICKDCGLSQLSVIVNPEKLFGTYFYRSSINQGYVKHCQELAEKVKKEYEIGLESFHVDIASNDGTLLKEFQKITGSKILGIDPAKNLARIAQEGGVPTLDDFWSKILAEQIVNTCGKADLITATNVFAHVDNIQEFLEACKIVLKKNGVLMIECPYFPYQVQNDDYTQTYFEHLSYMMVSPIYIVCENLDLNIVNVQIEKIHGGSIRLTIAHKDSLICKEPIVNVFLDGEFEGGFLNPETYHKWASKIDLFQDNIYNEITDLIERDFQIAAFSASAKGNILLNTIGLNHTHINYIVDETPEKMDKYSPGNGIIIVGTEEIQVNPPDYLLILSYNFKDEIIEKVRKLGYKGKFIIPIPRFKIIE